MRYAVGVATVLVMDSALIQPQSSLWELVSDSAGRARVVNAIGREVERSFRKHPVAHRTERENKRRISICLDLFDRLVGDEAWSTFNYEYSLAAALDAELSGETFNSSKWLQAWLAKGVI